MLLKRLFVMEIEKKYIILENEPIIEIKTEIGDEQTEIEIIPISNKVSRHIYDINDIEFRIQEKQDLIDELNIDIERLTNHADGVDNMIAVASGLLTGLIDAFFVGEFNFAELKADANKHVNKFIESYARNQGYDGNGRLKDIINFLEKKFPVEQDNIWKATGISSTKLHHLEDIAHHPTPFGLLAAIIVTFLRLGIFVDKKGNWHFETIDTNPKQLLKIWLPVIISGVLLWLIYLAKSKNPEKIEKLPKPLKKIVVALAAAPAVIEVLLVAHNWFGHLVSDVGGSKNTAGEGMGISGLFISLFKELAALSPLNETTLSKTVSDLYSKDKIDMRAELAIVEYLGKQAIPVILNEIIVRTFYFVRRLIIEKQQCKEWKDVNWQNVIPINNRTINRMLTIASGTFVAVDTADAAIRSAIKNGCNVHNPKLYVDFVLRLNFVGIGRFAIAAGTDIYMGCKREKLIDDRIRLHSEMLRLCNAKVFYKQAGMWQKAKDAKETLEKMEESAKKAVEYHVRSIEEILKQTTTISTYKPLIEKNNPRVIENISNKMEL